MTPEQEKAVKSLNDATEELRNLQTMNCETPEEEEARSKEIDRLVETVEARTAAVEKERRAAEALAKVESVRSATKATGITVRPVAEERKFRLPIGSEKPARCWDGDDEGAYNVGLYLRSLARKEKFVPTPTYRAASLYPVASSDSIADYGSGEDPTTFPDSMSKLVMRTLFNGLINEVGYTALCPQLARTFVVPTSGMQIPIADEAPYAKFYTELEHIDPVQPVVKAADLDLKKMAHLNYCSSELLEDTASAVSVANYVISTFTNSFAKTIDNTWLQGNAGIGVTGLVDAVCGFNGGAQCFTATAADTVTSSELSTMVMSVYRNTRNAVWLVSPTGWAALMAHAVDGANGQIITNNVQTSIYGYQVVLCTELPDDVMAVFGSFDQASAYGVKTNGVKIIASDTRAMEFDAVTYMGSMRAAWNTHSPQFLSVLKAPVGP